MSAGFVTKTSAALLTSLALGTVGACSSFGDASDAEPPGDGGSFDATADAPPPPVDSADPDSALEDGAPDAGPGCGSRVACARTVFVTKNTWSGKLGTVEGADKQCQTAADLTDHPKVAGRQYIAWISGVPAGGGPVSTPAARITAQGMAPYRLPTGEIVAADWNALASAQHQHALDVDEYGVLATVLSSHAWTGTAPVGTSLGGQCAGWTSNSDGGPLGRQGSITAIDAMWSDEGERSCFTEARLYCIEK